jgi:hypothetical protein
VCRGDGGKAAERLEQQSGVRPIRSFAGGEPELADKRLLARSRRFVNSAASPALPRAKAITKGSPWVSAASSASMLSRSAAACSPWNSAV